MSQDGQAPTRAVHGGTQPDPETGALLTPIHQNTTYAQPEPGQDPDYTYSRQANPTVAALERRLASLEGGEGCVAFASGMAAIDALLRVELASGDHVVVSEVCYGGTPRLLDHFYEPYGVEATYVDAGDAQAVEEALREETKLVLVETPGNPTLRLADVEAIAQLTQQQAIPLAVDNTFLTPVGQDVFDLGADISIHSTTKYIEGHNATIGGAVVVQEDQALLDRLRLVRKSAGTNQAPKEAWLTLRGLKTLPTRLAQVSQTATTLAERLGEHAHVEDVLYPGHEGFAQRKLAQAQHDHHGGILAFELDSYEEAAALGKHLDTIQLAENLGATETLLTHPASMTHGSLSPAQRERLGITPGLLRLSVGLESPEDLWEDLQAGLDALGGGSG